jgi:energy-converting hydrogenase Eha subunit A
MSLFGKLLSTGLLVILMGLLAAIAGAVVNGIMLGLTIDSLERARAPWSTVKKFGRIVALLVGLGMLAAMIAFFFNGILVTWNEK